MEKTFICRKSDFSITIYQKVSESEEFLSVQRGDEGVPFSIRKQSNEWVAANSLETAMLLISDWIDIEIKCLQEIKKEIFISDRS